MNRSDFMYRQKVKESEMDEAFDDAETAMHNLAMDIGLEGVVEGAVITQNSPLGMSVLSSASCRAYDQEGQRVYYAPQQVVDCSQDRDGASTTPASGQYATLMLTLAFDRLLDDLRTDGNGASVYYRRYESFAIYVTKGADNGSSPSTPPSAPSDELILCDIEIQDTTTQITNAMIDITRRQDFEWTDADHIDVTAGSWTKIDSTSDNVQDALDSVDNELIARETDGDIGEHLLPKDNTIDLGAAGNVWGEAHINEGTVYTSLMPSADGKALGSASSKRWDGYFTSINVLTSILANATGVDLGSATERFDAFLENSKIYGNIELNSEESTTCVVSHEEMTPSGSSSWAYGSLFYSTSGSEEDLMAWLDIPNGVSITGFDVSWYQVSDETSDMYAQLQSRVHGASSWSNEGTALTIDTFAAQTEDVKSGLSVTVNRKTTAYRVLFTSSSGAVENRVYSLKVAYDILDLTEAIKVN